MNEERLEKFAKEVEIMGFDRGVKTIIELILETSQNGKFTSIKYDSINKLYQEYKNQNHA